VKKKKNKKKKKKKKKKKIMAEIVATTSLPVDRLTATDCNAAARAKIRENVGGEFCMIQPSLQ